MKLIYEHISHFNLRQYVKSVPMGLPYTRRLMNPICRNDLLAAKAQPLLSLLMHAFKNVVIENKSLDKCRENNCITNEEEAGLKQS